MTKETRVSTLSVGSSIGLSILSSLNSTPNLHGGLDERARHVGNRHALGENGPQLASLTEGDQRRLSAEGSDNSTQTSTCRTQRRIDEQLNYKKMIYVLITSTRAVDCPTEHLSRRNPRNFIHITHFSFQVHRRPGNNKEIVKSLQLLLNVIQLVRIFASTVQLFTNF